MSKVAFSANLKIMSGNVCMAEAQMSPVGWSPRRKHSPYTSRDFKCWSCVLSSAEVMAFCAHCLREHLVMSVLEVSESQTTMDSWKATPVISDSSLRTPSARNSTRLSQDNSSWEKRETCNFL